MTRQLKRAWRRLTSDPAFYVLVRHAVTRLLVACDRLGTR